MITANSIEIQLQVAMPNKPLQEAIGPFFDGEDDANFIGKVLSYWAAAVIIIGKNASLAATSNIDSLVGVYVGERNGFGDRNGKGKFVWTSGFQGFQKGDVYEGEWFNDRMCGRGYLRSLSGAMYFGDFLNDKFHGGGSLHCAIGKYVGHFQNGLMHGYGVFKYTNGQQYHGNWIAGCMDGHGVFRYANSDVYEGHFKDNKQCGHGTHTYSNGDIYQGSFHDNYIHGTGRLIYHDGISIEGTWSYGKLHGEAKCCFPNGDVYRGTWIHGTRSDSVTFTTRSVGDEEETVYFGYWNSSGKNLILMAGCVDDGETSAPDSPVPPM